jgi:hypothetical protein
VSLGRGSLIARAAKLEQDEREFSDDVDHWNRMNPDEVPLERMDLSRQIDNIRSQLGLPPRSVTAGGVMNGQSSTDLVRVRVEEVAKHFAWLRPGVRVRYWPSAIVGTASFEGVVETTPWLLGPPGAGTWCVRLKDMERGYRGGARSTVPAAACSHLLPALLPPIFEDPGDERPFAWGHSSFEDPGAHDEMWVGAEASKEEAIAELGGRGGWIQLGCYEDASDFLPSADDLFEDMENRAADNGCPDFLDEAFDIPLGAAAELDALLSAWGARRRLRCNWWMPVGKPIRIEPTIAPVTVGDETLEMAVGS